jgi:hypothetical protein
METNSPFSATEICAIIEACHKSGVSSLKMGDLSVEFYQVPQLRRNADAGRDLPDGGETLPGFVGEYEVDTGAMPPIEFSDEDRALLEEARLAQLMTDNPAAYEQEVIDALQNPSP